MYNKPKISACLAIRDAEHIILPCLDRLKDYVNEIIIAIDTRTVDNTERVIKAWSDTHNYLPLKIINYNWVDKTLPPEDYDSFAAARNAGLKLATCEWVYIIDPDETPVNLPIPNNDCDLYIFNVRNYYKGRQVEDYPSPRLFKNKIGIKFRYANHEELYLDNINILKHPTLKRGHSIAVIEHKEKSHEQILKKSEWLLERHLKQLETEHDNPYVRGQICWCYIVQEQWQNAINYGTLALTGNLEPENKALIAIHLFQAYERIGDYVNADYCLRMSLAICPDQLSANAVLYSNAKINNDSTAMKYYRSNLEQVGSRSRLPYDIKFSDINF